MGSPRSTKKKTAGVRDGGREGARFELEEKACSTLKQTHKAEWELKWEGNVRNRVTDLTQIDRKIEKGGQQREQEKLWHLDLSGQDLWISGRESLSLLSPFWPML